jgi:hypothetical protein
MTQLNIHMTATFEKDLLKFMKIRHIPTKSEAIRIAIKEGLEHTAGRLKAPDFSEWAGLGKEVPQNKKLKFKSDDDLWK